MTSPFPSLLDDQLEVSQSGKWLVGGLDIQLGMRLTVPQQASGLCMTTQIATWSLFMDRSPRSSVTREWQWKSRASARGTLMNALSILDRVRSVQSAAVSFPVKFRCVISRACGKRCGTEPFSCITFCEGLVPDAQLLKSTIIIPKPSG